jgi:hypothetical protein
VDEHGIPACNIYLHVDDILISGPNYDTTCAALDWILDCTVRVGLICQPVKTKPPSQIQKFCGFIYDYTGLPTIRTPPRKAHESKITDPVSEKLPESGPVQACLVSPPGNFAIFCSGLSQRHWCFLHAEFIHGSSFFNVTAQVFLCFLQCRNCTKAFGTT